jgi:peptidyl-prolyl cis-trans isomerase D
MMTQMRENMPLIMWILVACFLGTIIFSWGMGGFGNKKQLDGVLGKVGNYEILYDRYNRAVQDKVAQERNKSKDKEKPAEITDTQIRQIKKDVWDDLVRQNLMKVYQERLGISTSDAEVAFAVQNNPPAWIRSHENFQKDGKFDKSKYDEFLRDPRSAQMLVAIETDYRESMNNQKVIDRIIAPIFVTPEEIWDDYSATSQRYNALVVSFQAKNYNVDSSSISSKDIESYYFEHKSDFQKKERRKLSYVTFPLVSTKDDTTRIYEIAQEALDRANRGEDFAALAQEYSEDPGSAANGGDLGYNVSGRMVKEFDSTMFATAPGKISGLVATRFGLHIIKVVDRKPGVADGDSVRASHILIKWKIGSDTEERVSQKAKDFLEAAKTDGFTVSASRVGAEVKDTDPFTKSPGGNIPGFGALQPICDFAFGSKKGALSYVVKTKARGSDGYSVFMLKDIELEGITPLSEVESTIRGILIQKKKEALAAEAARNFRGRVNNLDQLVAEANRQGIKIDTTGDHTRRDYVPSFGNDENIGKQILKLNPGQVSDVLSNSKGGFVAAMLSKSAVDSAGFNGKKDEITDNLRKTKQNRVYADWLANAQKEIGVVDKRYLYFTDF